MGVGAEVVKGAAHVGRRSESATGRPLAGSLTRLLKETRSRHGRVVRLEIERGSYKGAEPYFSVIYMQKKGERPQEARYSPLRARAEWFFTEFTKDRLETALDHRPPQYRPADLEEMSETWITAVWEQARADWRAAGFESFAVMRAPTRLAHIRSRRRCRRAGPAPARD